MLTKALDHASSATLTPRPPSLRKKHITARTWEKIQELQAVSVDTPLASVRIATLRRQVKHVSLQDKKDFISDNLLEDYRGTPADKYNQVKKLRSVFQPRPTKVRHPNGHIATVEQRATTLAYFWAQNVWKAPPPLSTPLDMTPIYDEPAQVRTDPFTMQELNMILHRLKNRKAPGSDGIPSEFWKWASPYFLEVLLQHLNDCLLSASAPDKWNEALVAMLPTASSDPSHPASNRPIALTQTSYKIYAALLQRRLQQGLESRIRPHQYGFRPHKSTSQPCHIIRRILELYERQGETLHLLFLDWAKAFDTIS